MKPTLPFSEPSNGGAATPPGRLGRLLFAYALVLVIVVAASSFCGSTTIEPAAVWRSLVGEDDGRLFSFWFDFRYRRIVYAAAVGATLALAGTLFQAVLRNPLAEPYILGISGAASLGTMCAGLIAGGAAAGGAWLAVWSTIGPLGGAVAGTVLLLGLARWAGLYDPPSIILSGTVLNAIFGALILLLYTLMPERQVVSSLLWLMGNIGTESLLGGDSLRNTLIALVAGGLVAASVARHLDLLSLGEEEAADLGLSPRRFRITMLTIASLVAGVAVAAAGPIGFVGLIVPHVVRRLHGPAHRALVPLSMAGGAVFLVACDTLSRTLLAPRQVPIGVVTALLGGPFFLFLLGAHRRGESV